MHPYHRYRMVLSYGSNLVLSLISMDINFGRHCDVVNDPVDNRVRVSLIK
jgi:hypothetical protein